MITLGQLKTEITYFVAKQGINSRIPLWANLAATKIVNRRPFWWNIRKDSVTTEDGVAEYFFSSEVSDLKIKWFGDESGTFREIKKVPLDSIYRYDSTPTDEGTPEFWAPVGIHHVTANNESDVVTVVSSSASDSQYVIVRGKVSGILRYEQITLNGTAPVDGTLTWDEGTIESVTLSAAGVGVVTATTGTTTITSIAPGYQRTEAAKFRLWRVPGEVLTLPYVFYKKVNVGVKDSDVIDLPDSALEALILGTEYYAHKNNGSIDRALQIKQQFYAEIDELYSISNQEHAMQVGKDFVNKSMVIERLPEYITGSVTA